MVSRMKHTELLAYLFSTLFLVGFVHEHTHFLSLHAVLADWSMIKDWPTSESNFPELC